MINSKKKYIFFGLIVILAGSSFVGYRYWVNSQDFPEIVSQDAIQKEACEDIAKESGEPQSAIAEEPDNAGNQEEQQAANYPIHQDITSTVFWVGEKATDDNNDISNSPSAWDEKWKKHYGGVDSSTKRSGFLPAKFCPKENPFYVALPYNDFGKNGKHKDEIFSLVPWTKGRNIPDNYSVLKNRWIKIVHNDKTAYAQWEDVGPFEEDDEAYVFGTATPKSRENKGAGIDVSPAVRDYLGLSDMDKVTWQFIDTENVPDGAWKKIITTSQVYWK